MGKTREKNEQIGSEKLNANSTKNSCVIYNFDSFEPLISHADGMCNDAGQFHQCPEMLELSHCFIHHLNAKCIPF